MFCRHFKVKEDTVYASEGGVVELKVYVTGNPQPDVYWRKGTNRDIDTRQGKYIIVDDSSLKVGNILSMYKNCSKTIWEKYIYIYLYIYCMIMLKTLIPIDNWCGSE